MNQLLTVAEAVAGHARVHPDRLGARDSRRELSFGRWNERATRLANGLLGLGLAPGDRVALLAYNCIEWMELYVALARAGLVAVPINFRLTAAEIAYIAEHSEARAFVVQHELFERVALIHHGLAIEARRWVGFGAPAPAGWSDYEDLIAAASGDAPAVSVRPADACALMYTSGTTGRPKGAIRSHEGNTLIALATALEMGFRRDDTALLVMPMCHANSLYFSHTFAHLGAACIVDDRRSFDAESLLATLAREKVTFTSLVPTHYIMMLGLPAATKARHDVGAVTRLMISSAPARRETKLAILEHFPNAGLYELYGSTEAGWVTLLHPDEQIERMGSVGREWAGSGPIRILDPEGREVADGEVGELYSRTPYVFDGYWKNLEKTAEAFHGDCCSVGDLGRRDGDGYIHLVDRKSNMIISGGENVYPSEVEGVLGGHPKVKDVAVIGVPHDKWGEAVRAVLVLHAEAEASEDEILAWCRPRMAGYKRPQSVLFVADADMPRTATGKILHPRAARSPGCRVVKLLSAQPNLVEQVRSALLDEIASGQLAPGERVIQEQVALALGVSRQPVQQALALLRSQGVLHDAPGRGLIVVPLDPEHVQHMYDMRAVIEGLACRRAAENNADKAARLGPALIDAGRKAVASGSVARMIAADMKFHEFIYALSGNPLVAPALASHLTHTQRVMGEVLMRDEKPRDIWNQHARILDAIAAGDAERAEALTRAHITRASGFMVARLRQQVAERAPALPTGTAH